MSTPLPDKSVRGSSSGVPLMALFDLLGRRWNLRIMWELRQCPHSFRGLQSACGGVSPSVLNNRIKQLAEAQLLVVAKEGYQLTELGTELMTELDPLRSWSAEWAKELGSGS